MTRYSAIPPATPGTPFRRRRYASTSDSSKTPCRWRFIFHHFPEEREHCLTSTLKPSMMRRDSLPFAFNIDANPALESLARTLDKSRLFCIDRVYSWFGAGVKD